MCVLAARVCVKGRRGVQQQVAGDVRVLIQSTMLSARIKRQMLAFGRIG